MCHLIRTSIEVAGLSALEFTFFESQDLFLLCILWPCSMSVSPRIAHGGLASSVKCSPDLFSRPADESL